MFLPHAYSAVDVIGGVVVSRVVSIKLQDGQVECSKLQLRRTLREHRRKRPLTVTWDMLCQKLRRGVQAAGYIVDFAYLLVDRLSRKRSYTGVGVTVLAVQLQFPFRYQRRYQPGVEIGSNAIAVEVAPIPDNV